MGGGRIVMEVAMSRCSPYVITLEEGCRQRLERLARRATGEARMVLRARIVLSAAAGEENLRIGQRLGVATNTVLKWRKRFFEEGIDGLADRKRPGRPRSFSPSGGDRGEGAGLPAARNERRSAVALELRGVGV